MEGKKVPRYDDKNKDRSFFIGPVEAPLHVCKRKEVAELFTRDFGFYLEIWSYFHYGFGLPGGRSWDELDPDLASILLGMEAHYRKYFSVEIVQIKYLEGIINHLKAGFRLK